MRNLLRALRLAFHFRWSVITATVCSMLIALTWGSNLAAVYPFVEVIFDGQTLNDWVDEQATSIETQLAELKEQEAAPAAAGPAAVMQLNDERQSLQRKLEIYQRAKPYVQAYAPVTPFGTLVALIGFLLTMTLTRCVLLGINMVLVTRVSQGVVRRLQNDLFRAILSSDLANFERYGTGTLASRIHYETRHVGNSVQTLIGKLLREPLKLITCLIGAAFVNWRLLLVSLLICPAAVFILTKISGSIKRTTQKALEGSAGLMNQLIESLTYVKAVKAHNMQVASRSEVRQTTSKLYRMQMKISFYDALLRGNNEVLGTGVVCMSLLAGGYLVLAGQTHIFGIRMSSTPMTFSTLVLFYGLLLGTTDPLRKLGGVHTNIRMGALAADRLYGHMDQAPEIRNPATGQTIPQGPARLQYQDVTFGYRDDQTVLDNITLDVAAGERIAIVGANGCGKSTLVDLLPRFYEPRSGKILLDGIPLTEYRMRDLRRYITVVSQQAALFNDTIASNIAYGCQGADDEAIRLAAERAHAIEFIDALPDGFETKIGEHGNRLSGGQRQRLALARAILRDSPLIILDEATSQIDPESEQLIHMALVPFLQGRTALMITHRSSTIRLADRIVVMEQGRIIADGKHEQLLATSQAYRTFRETKPQSLEQAA